jgi:hypothetical protein
MTISRILLASILTLAAPCALADESSDLLAWVGKHPSDKLVEGHGSLFAQPRIRDGLRALLPTPEQALLTKLDIESQVRRMGNFLVIDKCLPHDCPAQQAMIIVDLASDRLWAAFFTHVDGRLSTRWYGNKEDYNTVPQEIQLDFLKRHGSVVP